MAKLQDTRPKVHILPEVKAFTTGVQLELLAPHVLRSQTRFGMSYERATYLLYVHAGYLPARSADETALRDLSALLVRGRELAA